MTIKQIFPYCCKAKKYCLIGKYFYIIMVILLGDLLDNNNNGPKDLEIYSKKIQKQKKQ